jgi:1-acyl-sn-glycerol-3-phosphate acyltransferase
MTPRNLLRASRRAARGLFDAFAEVGGARLYPPADARAAAHRLAAAAGAIARAHELAVTVRGDIPRSPALVVTHRVACLDALALLPVCPAIPVAPASVIQWPVVGSLATAFGVVLVTRADPMARARALRRVHDLLQAGVSVVDVALARRTSELPEVGEFRRGAFGIAARLGVPIVPVAIRYAHAGAGRGDAVTARAGSRGYFDLAAHPRIAIELLFGAPIYARPGEPAELLADRARHRIARTLHLAAPSPASARLRVA